MSSYTSKILQVIMHLIRYNTNLMMFQWENFNKEAKIIQIHQSDINLYLRCKISEPPKTL